MEKYEIEVQKELSDILGISYSGSHIGDKTKYASWLEIFAEIGRLKAIAESYQKYIPVTPVTHDQTSTGSPPYDVTCDANWATGTKR